MTSVIWFKAMLATMIAVTASAAHAVSYTIRDLGSFAGTSSSGNGVNDSGQAVGFSLTAGGQPRGFLYDQGALSVIDTFGRTNSAQAINNSGQIVGNYLVPNFFTGDSDLRAYIFSNGSAAQIPTLGGRTNTANSINDFGVVIGESSYSNGNRSSYMFYNNSLSDIGAIIGPQIPLFNSIRAFDINNSNQVTGSILSVINSVEVARAFIYNSGSIQFLGTLGGIQTTGFSINNFGSVTGSSVDSNGLTNAFIYENGMMTSIGSFGSSFSGGYGINDDGIVVGHSFLSDNSSRAFIYDGQSMQDLNDLIDPSLGWVLSQARSISNTGLIVGTGSFNGQGRAFLLTPIRTGAVPEPASWTMLIAGFGLVGASLRRRRPVFVPA